MLSADDASAPVLQIVHLPGALSGIAVDSLGALLLVDHDAVRRARIVTRLNGSIVVRVQRPCLAPGSCHGSVYDRGALHSVCGI